MSGTGQRPCLICCSPITNQNKASSKIKVNYETTTFFIVKTLLEVPYSVCVDLLQNEGNPSNWFQCCWKCFILAKKAKEVFSQMKRLETQYKRLKESLEFEFCENQKQKISTPKPKSRKTAMEVIQGEVSKRLSRSNNFLIQDMYSQPISVDSARKKIKTEVDNSEAFYSDGDSIPENCELNPNIGYVNRNDETADVDSDYSYQPSATDSDSDSKNKRSSNRIRKRLGRVSKSLNQSEVVKHFPCKFCASVSNTENEWKLHEKQNHGINHTFSCNGCSELYTSYEDLREHIERKCPTFKSISNSTTATDTTNESEQKKTRKEYVKGSHEWNEVAVYDSLEDAKTSAQIAGIWRYFTKRIYSMGVRINYTCKHWRQCAHKMHLNLDNTTQKVTMYINEKSHTHTTERRKTLSNEIKTVINECFQKGFKPRKILGELKKRDLQLEKSQLSNYLVRLRHPNQKSGIKVESVKSEDNKFEDEKNENAKIQDTKNEDVDVEFNKLSN